MADAQSKVCSVDECGSKPVSRNLCPKHYTRLLRHGDPLTTKKIHGDDQQRFWSNVAKTNTCWNWTGYISSTGYGIIRIGNNAHYAHRYSYEVHAQMIPNGMYIDHMCHNTRCVNPAHLRTVWQKQNVENHQGARVDSSTGVRGVHVDKKSGKFVTQVTHNGVTHCRGGFATLDEASSFITERRNELFTHNDYDRTPKPISAFEQMGDK